MVDSAMSVYLETHLTILLLRSVPGSTQIHYRAVTERSCILAEMKSGRRSPHQFTFVLKVYRRTAYIMILQSLGLVVMAAGQSGSMNDANLSHFKIVWKLPFQLIHLFHRCNDSCVRKKAEKKGTSAKEKNEFK